MDGRTNAGSGGGFAAAAVSVTYPSGSLCVAHHPESNISITDYKKSGKKLFLLPKSGSWDFEISNDDGKSTEKTLDVEESDAKTIKMSYWDGELFDNGNEFDDVTGGWDVFYPRTDHPDAKYISISKADGALYIQTTADARQGQWHAVGLITHNTIDLSPYSKLHAQVSGVYIGNSGQPSAGAAIVPTTDGTAYEDFWNGNNLRNRISTTGEYVVDISSWSAGRIAFIVSTRDPSVLDWARTSKIWLS